MVGMDVVVVVGWRLMSNVLIFLMFDWFILYFGGTK
jgi:hypothetical protein